MTLKWLDGLKGSFDFIDARFSTGHFLFVKTSTGNNHEGRAPKAIGSGGLMPSGADAKKKIALERGLLLLLLRGFLSLLSSLLCFLSSHVHLLEI
jgi:hypothetical protein